MSKKISISKEFLIKEYITNFKSSIIIANELGCNKVTICRYLRMYKIKRTKILTENIGLNFFSQK